MTKRSMSATPLDSFRQDRPLAESIVIATRGIHARLNKLIMARLPLVLPPQAEDSFVYASGLLHIAPIYTTFESSWHDIVRDSFEHSVDTSRDGSRPRKPIVSDHLRNLLDSLHLPGLVRTARLVADVQSITGWTEDATREQLAIVSRTGHLAEFVSHIKRAIRNKPHVLLAYSYIMYMALFAGGRFVRATLESADEGFWDTTASSAMPVPRPREDKLVEETPRQEQAESLLRRPHGDLPLRFFHFDTPDDGEDLKRDFKRQLADGEAMLSYREKHDIVQEAICIFENMILVVAQLDIVLASGPVRTPPDSPISVDSAATTIKQPLVRPRFRDSVLVTKERSARCSSNRMSGVSSSSSDGEDDHKSGAKTASTPDKTPPSEPDNHPTIPPSTREEELCPAVSKSIRFEKTPPHPLRSNPSGVADSAADLTESLKMASKRLRREHVTN
ncbi:heme oxygenase [Metarhizium rileyi]|uniref:Heme oxygenase n=1 Tax=Metarhizium rileyi (strain RCEF 4871) TaxID=1649241 RepID=A0A166XWG0_METRR|nr:heme oxygenase [Metarhizium rileyi RCEF 4871]TWU72141.1 heme oxygenase [Metarhizium rileyi]